MIVEKEERIRLEMILEDDLVEHKQSDHPFVPFQRDLETFEHKPRKRFSTLDSAKFIVKQLDCDLSTSKIVSIPRLNGTENRKDEETRTTRRDNCTLVPHGRPRDELASFSKSVFSFQRTDSI